MKLLRGRLPPDAVHHALDLQVPQRRREVDTAVRVDVNLPAQLRAQLQLDAADGRAVVVRLRGLADRAGEGERVREAAAGGRRGAGAGRVGRGVSSGLAAAHLEFVEDLVDGFVGVGFGGGGICVLGLGGGGVGAVGGGGGLLAVRGRRL